MSWSLGSRESLKTLSRKCLNNSFPSLFKSLDSLFELFVLPFPLVVTGGRDGNKRYGCGYRYPSAKAAVLLLQLSDPAFKVGELCFAAVARVLGCDTVTVGSGLLAVL